MAAFRIGDLVPNFDADSTLGAFNLHSYFGEGWGILFSHPADYTPVCTTELGRVATLEAEAAFASRNTKVCALSCESAESHRGWVADINASQGVEVAFPIIADPDRAVATQFGMLDMAPDGEKDAAFVGDSYRGSL